MFHFTPWYFSINHQNMVYAIKNRPSSVQIPYPWATIKCSFQGKSSHMGEKSKNPCEEKYGEISKPTLGRQFYIKLIKTYPPKYIKCIMR